MSNFFPQVCFEHSIYGGIRCDFTNFSNQVSADLHNFRFRLNLKNCQTIAGISQIFRLTALNKNEKWPTLTTRVEAVAWKLSFQFPSGVTNMEAVDMVSGDTLATFFRKSRTTANFCSPKQTWLELCCFNTTDKGEAFSVNRWVFPRLGHCRVIY